VNATPQVASRMAKSRLLGIQLLLVALVGVVLVRCAWHCDDAYLTFRTAWNWVHGYGLRWNVVERVQSYTHPLWMLCSAACLALSGEVYYSTLGLAVVMTLVAVTLLARQCPVPEYGIVAIVLFVSSGAAVDYCVSGLETPLVVLLLVVFMGLLSRPAGDAQVLLLTLVASLIALTRLDALVLVLPALGQLAYDRRSKRTAALLVLGFLPLAMWHAVSLVYYGFLWPNTAYAKLNLHVSLAHLAGRGCVYLVDSLVHDPLTLVTIAAGHKTARDSGSTLDRRLALGITLYLLYILRIGGDFMSGRFLVAPLVVAIGLLRVHPGWARTRRTCAVAGGILVVALLLPRSRLRSGSDYGSGAISDFVHAGGIVDERGYYYGTTGLLNVWSHRAALARSGAPVPPQRWAVAGLADASKGIAVELTWCVGFYSYFVGPGTYVLDLYSLGDPLLARLPFAPDGEFRFGHYDRPVPAGYPESVLGPVSQIEDPGIAEYDNVLRLITRGPLFTTARWNAIVGMQLGRYDHLLPARYPEAARPPR